MTCPDEARFRQAVVRRVGYDPFFAWAKTTVVVEIVGDGSAFVARVRLVDNAGLSRGIRELRSGPTGCQGLVDAAALAISIALDIESSVVVDRPSSSATPVDSARAAPPLVHSAPAPAFTSRPEAAAEPERVPPPAPSQAALQAIVGLDALAPIGAAPDIAPGIDMWGGGRLGRGLLGLELRVDGPDSAAFARGGHASILFMAAGLEACAYLGSFFACALGNADWLYASGSGVAMPGSGSAFGVAFGPRVGLELPVAGPWVLRAKGDLLVNAIRPGVSLNGAAWSVPQLGGVLGVGVAYRFP